MPGLEVTMTADEADLFAKMTALMAKAGESERAFEKASDKSKAAAEAARQAAKEQERSASAGKRLAEQLERANESLEESYNRQVQTLEAGFESGKISAEKFRSSIGELDKRFDQLRQAEEATGQTGQEALREHNAQIRSAIDYVKRLERETGGLEAEQAELKRSLESAWKAGKLTSEQYADALQKVDEETGKVKEEQKSLFGEAKSALAQQIVQWGSVSAAASAVTLAIEKQNEAMQRGAEHIKNRDQGRRDLASVSADEREFYERRKQATYLETKEGLTADRASQIIFKLDSVGLISENQTIDKNNEVSRFFGGLEDIGDADAFASLAAQMSASFGSGYKEAVNVGFQSASDAPFDPGTFASQLADASKGAQLFKVLGDDRKLLAAETAALTGVLSKSYGTSTGTIVKGGAVKLADVYKDSTLLEAARKANQLSDDERKKLFGDNENVKFLLDAVASQSNEIDQAVGANIRAQMSAGTDESFVNIRKRIRLSDPDAQIAKHVRTTEAKRLEAEQLLGRRELINQMAYMRNQTDNARGMGFMNTGFRPVDRTFNTLGNEIMFGRPGDVLGPFNVIGGANASNVLGIQAGGDGIDYSMQRAAEEAHYRKQVLEALNAVKENTMKPVITKPGDDR